MDQTLITVSRYSITYYQNDLFICAQYANKHKATALHKAYWLPCLCYNLMLCSKNCTLLNKRSVSCSNQKKNSPIRG